MHDDVDLGRIAAATPGHSFQSDLSSGRKWHTNHASVIRDRAGASIGGSSVGNGEKHGRSTVRHFDAGQRITSNLACRSRQLNASYGNTRGGREDADHAMGFTVE